MTAYTLSVSSILSFTRPAITSFEELFNHGDAGAQLPAQLFEPNWSKLNQSITVRSLQHLDSLGLFAPALLQEMAGLCHAAMNLQAHVGNTTPRK